jgi:glycosyltransferase involved in cell wall biosynthesis
MRVLVVVHQMVPDQSALWSGAARAGVDLHLAGALAGTSTEGYCVETGAPPDLSSHVLQPVALRAGRGHLWWILRGLGPLVRRLRPDVVHVHSEPWGLMVTQAIRAHRVVVPHGAENRWDTAGGQLERGARVRLARRNLHLAAAFVGWNRQAVDLAVGNGLCSGVTAVVPGIVPDPQLLAVAAAGADETRQALGLVGRHVVGFVGRDSPEKGLDVLLGALRRLPIGPRPVSALLVGAGTQRYDGDVIGDVTVRGVGVKPYREAAQLLAACDVIAIPSRDSADVAEQFSRVALEAALARVPVVAAAVGALPEVVGDAGVLTPPEDARALAGALTELLGDADERDRLAGDFHARARALFDPEVLGARLVDTWRRALER